MLSLLGAAAPPAAAAAAAAADAAAAWGAPAGRAAAYFRGSLLQALLSLPSCASILQVSAAAGAAECMGGPPKQRSPAEWLAECKRHLRGARSLADCPAAGGTCELRAPAARAPQQPTQIELVPEPPQLRAVCDVALQRVGGARSSGISTPASARDLRGPQRGASPRLALEVLVQQEPEVACLGAVRPLAGAWWLRHAIFEVRADPGARTGRAASHAACLRVCPAPRRGSRACIWPSKNMGLIVAQRDEAFSTRDGVVDLREYRVKECVQWDRTVCCVYLDRSQALPLHTTPTASSMQRASRSGQVSDGAHQRLLPSQVFPGCSSWTSRGRPAAPAAAGAAAAHQAPAGATPWPPTSPSSAARGTGPQQRAAPCGPAGRQRRLRGAGCLAGRGSSSSRGSSRGSSSRAGGCSEQQQGEAGREGGGRSKALHLPAAGPAGAAEAGAQLLRRALRCCWGQRGIGSPGGRRRCEEAIDLQLCAGRRVQNPINRSLHFATPARHPRDRPGSPPQSHSAENAAPDRQPGAEVDLTIVACG
jgi:hypothetical protein